MILETFILVVILTGSYGVDGYRAPTSIVIEDIPTQQDCVTLGTQMSKNMRGYQASYCYPRKKVVK